MTNIALVIHTRADDGINDGITLLNNKSMAVFKNCDLFIRVKRGKSFVANNLFSTELGQGKSSKVPNKDMATFYQKV